MPDHTLDSGDSQELEDLFNSIAASQPHEDQPVAEPAPAAAGVELVAAETMVQITDPAEVDASVMYEQIGQLTRKLHDAMQHMGYEKSLESVIPDAKDRLAYIANLTENAAERVLNATDIAKPILDKLESGAVSLSDRWEKVFANQLSVDEFRKLAEETRHYFRALPDQTQATSAQMLEIVMAQDFQDLTGQVIKKMMEMFKGVESELISFLIAYSPSLKKVEVDPGLLNGPVVNPEGRSDVVTNQQQVDDLLESLGF